MARIDPVVLSQELIRCPSVTPQDAGALGVLETVLKPLGFACERLRFQREGTVAVDNLYARIGKTAPLFCFAGHTDVVPVGDRAGWRHDPFAAQIVDGVLYGRGAADMKSAVAAFAAAAERVLARGTLKGSIGLLITGDEEGDAINGTEAVLEWLSEKGERIDHCLVGEPTANAAAGDTIKIGRRGSMRVEIAVTGVQGHTAYPQRAVNPIPLLSEIVTRLADEPLDTGTAHFEPSTLVFTTFDVGNPAGNVSPAIARAACNIRFNDAHTPDALVQRIEKVAGAVTAPAGAGFALKTTVGGHVFVTEPGAYTDLLARTIARVTNLQPELSTTGGTSDARFIRKYCPVAEVGLPGTTMHKVDECVPVAEIEKLADIYTAILDAYFADPPS